MSDVGDEELEREVAGEYNTLRVYLFMLRTKKASAREVQEGLSLSSPRLAQHHLDKLSKYNLVAKSYEGSYHVRSRSFGILKLYLKSGKWIVPRTLFFVIIFGALTTGFMLSISEHRYFSIAFLASLGGMILAIIETIRFYRVLPRN